MDAVIATGPGRTAIGDDDDQVFLSELSIFHYEIIFKNSLIEKEIDNDS